MRLPYPPPSVCDARSAGPVHGVVGKEGAPGGERGIGDVDERLRETAGRVVGDDVVLCLAGVVAENAHQGGVAAATVGVGGVCIAVGLRRSPPAHLCIQMEDVL